MNFETSELKDSEGAYAIARDLPDFFTPSTLEKIKLALVNEMAFGVYSDGNTIGFLTVREVNDNVAEVTWMGIKKEFHHKGAGTKLLNYSLAKLKGKYKIALFLL